LLPSRAVPTSGRTVITVSTSIKAFWDLCVDQLNPRVARGLPADPALGLQAKVGHL
jgi:hypothetical protein